MKDNIRYVSIPASIVITVEEDFDIEDDDALFKEVMMQHGKYIEVDATSLGYDFAEVVG